MRKLSCSYDENGRWQRDLQKKQNKNLIFINKILQNDLIV